MNISRSIEPALLAAREALGFAPAGLFTDVDGTISHIVDDPEAARVSPAIRAALRRIRNRVDTLAVVSGRAAADARRMVRIGGISYIGNHGLERIHRGRVATDLRLEPFKQAVHECMQALPSLLTDDELILEDKGATATIHYRSSREPGKARATIIRAIGQCTACQGLRLEDGRRVVNLLPPVTVNKGTAVALMVRQRSLKGVVYLGDDATDVHAFTALRELRQLGVRTVAIAVESPESPPSILTQADAVVWGVEGAEELLERLSANEP